jgi:hypothetical protein
MTRDEWLRAEIDGFRKKIETYQAFIAEYEQQLGLTPQSSSQSGPASVTGKRSDTAVGDDPLTWITGMIFFNKTQPEAAKIVLERVGYPLRTEQLMEAVQKGGVTIGGKTDTAKKQNFYTILNRNADFGRAKRDTWGLIGWPGISKKSAEDEKPEKDSKTDQ